MCCMPGMSKLGWQNGMAIPEMQASQICHKRKENILIEGGDIQVGNEAGYLCLSITIDGVTKVSAENLL